MAVGCIVAPIYSTNPTITEIDSNCKYHCNGWNKHELNINYIRNLWINRRCPRCGDSFEITCESLFKIRNWKDIAESSNILSVCSNAAISFQPYDHNYDETNRPLLGHMRQFCHLMSNRVCVRKKKFDKHYFDIYSVIHLTLHFWLKSVYIKNMKL